LRVAIRRRQRGAFEVFGDEERAESNILNAIVEEYLSREDGRLRSVGDRRAAFQRHVLPKLGDRQIGDIP
jgi:hypothetical protein